MSIIDTSTWNPDPALNESIGDIPLNETASIRQTWQAIQMLMAAGGLHGLQLVTFEGATASADGKQGLVPAPEAGDQDKVLKGDGTWGDAASGITGFVTGPESSMNNGVAIFDGVTGTAIKDSGHTIDSDVPLNAVFTDTTYDRVSDAQIDALFAS